MLEGAAAADPEMRADWRYAVGLCVVLTWLRRHPDQLARKRERHEKRTIRALRYALGAEALEPDLKLYGGRRPELPRCRSRLEWGRASRRTPSTLAAGR